MNNEDYNTQTPVGNTRASLVTPHGSDPDNSASSVSGTTPYSSDSNDEASELTPPQLADAIDDIGNFEFDFKAELKKEEDAETEAIATAFMMFSPTKTATSDLPRLRTEEWPYAGKKPNPISIGMARRFLAAAYAEVPCEAKEAGEHGYAWIAEMDKMWLEQDGVTTVIVSPTKPEEPTEFDMKAQWKYTRDLDKWTLYQHLIQEGKSKIMEWFDKAMFLDLFKNGLLPTGKTPPDIPTVNRSTHVGHSFSSKLGHRT